MKTISKKETNEIKIKKSRFICHLFPVRDISEVKEKILAISTEYKDATHNCTAYIVNGMEGSNDDGEPGGTAGKPMLNVLRKNDLENILAIVTRYFGGIKLGSGGLVRAYSKSVQDTIAVSEMVDLKIYSVYEISFDYNNLKSAESIIRNNGFNVVEKKYDEKITYKIAILKNKDKTSIIDGLKSSDSNLFQLNFLKDEYLNLDNE
ncbi:MAG: YigZ family protein [Methanobrevibacter sp.]|jgi:uncharacterized YigZ family protein|nr:YigZ family protein [Methanobrevibacter sp.]